MQMGTWRPGPSWPFTVALAEPPCWGLEVEGQGHLTRVYGSPVLGELTAQEAGTCRHSGEGRSSVGLRQLAGLDHICGLNILQCPGREDFSLAVPG